MNIEEKKKKQSDLFKINVNKIVTVLLEKKVLFMNPGSASMDARQLVSQAFGLSDRQAQRYLAAARKEVLKITEAQKKKAVLKAIKLNEIPEILP